MKIVFIGQAPFGRDSLEALLEQGEDIAGVITVPDAPGGKRPNPVAEGAREHSLPLFQTALLKKPEAVEWVKRLEPDLLVLAFVTSFVPKAMIDCARLGGINYHPSLLPKYRGGSAINWAIINGEKETGVTIHFIDEGVDTGPILLQEPVVIEPDDTVKSVYFKKLYPLGVKMLAESVRQIREGKAVAVAQDEAEASFQPVISSADTIIDWDQPIARIYDLVRGANPSPGAVTSLHGNSCKIFDARPGQGGGTPGEIIAVDDDSFTVAARDGSLQVETAQAAGGKKQPAAEFGRDHNLTVGDVFGR